MNIYYDTKWDSFLKQMYASLHGITRYLDFIFNESELGVIYVNQYANSDRKIQHV